MSCSSSSSSSEMTTSENDFLSSLGDLISDAKDQRRQNLIQRFSRTREIVLAIQPSRRWDIPNTDLVLRVHIRTLRPLSVTFEIEHQGHRTTRIPFRRLRVGASWIIETRDFLVRFQIRGLCQDIQSNCMNDLQNMGGWILVGLRIVPKRQSRSALDLLDRDFCSKRTSCCF